eukprot:2265167-Pleurochrysis_carterae.AAC.5
MRSVAWGRRVKSDCACGRGGPVACIQTRVSAPRVQVRAARRAHFESARAQRGGRPEAAHREAESAGAKSTRHARIRARAQARTHARTAAETYTTDCLTHSHEQRSVLHWPLQLHWLRNYSPLQKCFALYYFSLC